MMDIKRIVVSEIPEGYKNKKSIVEVETYASYINENKKYVTEYFHGFIDDPLVIEETCVWVGKYPPYDYPDTTGDMLFMVTKTSCSDGHSDTVSVVDYKFCPNCGRRIAYESEV